MMSPVLLGVSAAVQQRWQLPATVPVRYDALSQFGGKPLALCGWHEEPLNP